MTGWADHVHGQLEPTRVSLQRALRIDQGNANAARIMSGLPWQLGVVPESARAMGP